MRDTLQEGYGSSRSYFPPQIAPPPGHQVYNSMRLWGHFSFKPPHSISLTCTPVQLLVSLRQSGFFHLFCCQKPLYNNRCWKVGCRALLWGPCLGFRHWTMSCIHINSFSYSHSAAKEKLLSILLFCSVKNQDVIQFPWHSFVVQISFLSISVPGRALSTGESSL